MLLVKTFMPLPVGFEWRIMTPADAFEFNWYRGDQNYTYAYHAQVDVLGSFCSGHSFRCEKRFHTLQFVLLNQEQHHGSWRSESLLQEHVEMAMIRSLRDAASIYGPITSMQGKSYGILWRLM